MGFASERSDVVSGGFSVNVLPLGGERKSGAFKGSCTDLVLFPEADESKADG